MEAELRMQGGKGDKDRKKKIKEEVEVGWERDG